MHTESRAKPPPEAFDGGYAIVQIRLEALKRAIGSREWEEVEFQYDRVLRACTKWRDGMAKTVDELQEIVHECPG